MKLTTNEKLVLKALFESAEGNGHDFGFTDEHGLADKKTAGGVVASLQKKGILRAYVDDKYKQFTWKMPVEEVKALIEGSAS